MKKYVSLIVFVLIAIASVSMTNQKKAHANTQTAMPTDQEILVMGNMVEWMWDRGFENNAPVAHMDNQVLLGNVFKFLIEECYYEGINREDSPEFFDEYAENYTFFFNKEITDNTAKNLFNAVIDKNNLPEFVLESEYGYFVDPNPVNEHFNNPETSNFPGFLVIDSIEAQSDGSVVLNGKLRRFEEDFEELKKEYLIQLTLVTATFKRTETGEWQLVDFVMEEEAMG